jgi:endonuclease YncB( thermonuclease family)
MLIGGLSLSIPPAMAAEILSVRNATLLQVGDQNRSYGVQLACIEVSETNNPAALAWLQRHGSRGQKVNLRPVAERDGMLVAKVSLLKTGVDLGAAMVAEGLATPVPCLDGSS